jgi:iron complex transport system substrate-binding protein
LPGNSSHSARRIVCLQPSATVILNSIGELHRVVACTRYCAEVVAGVADGSRIIVNDSWTANAHQIAEAHPDLVIASVPYQEKAVSEILRVGVPFLGLAPKTLRDIYADIAMIAAIVGAASRGEEVIAAMQQRIETIRSRTTGMKRPRVFCEEWGKPLIASQRWVAELVEIAGGDFLGNPGAQITPAEVQQFDPEVLIAAWCGAGDRVPLEKVLAQRNWQNTAAGVTGRVFCIPDEFLNTPAPTLLQGLDALAYALHPEVFPCTKGIRQITDVPASTVSNSKA